MSETYLIRHGQTAWNKEQRFRGWHNVPLNEQGRREAGRLAEALADVALCGVFSSPLCRAMETAEIVRGERKVLVLPDQDFVDINYGAWTGMAEADVRTEFPDVYRKWREKPECVCFPEGESLAEVRQRAVGGLRRVAEVCAGHAAAIVTHRVVLKVLLAAVTGRSDASFWEIPVDTASFSVLRTEGGVVRLVCGNDVRHLEGLGGHESIDF